MTRRRPLMIALALLALLLGAGLRAWQLTRDPLWLDEAYSAFAASHDLHFLWHVVPLYESHPPFYYMLLHLWVLGFGDGLLSLRLLGLIAGLAAPFVIAAAAVECSQWLPDGRRRRASAALVAFILSWLSMALVTMSREVRPYPLIILVYAAAITLLLRIGRNVREGRAIGGRLLAGYSLLLAALLWLHNLDVLYAAALTLAFAVAVYRQPLSPRDRRWLVAAHAIVALLYVPALLILRMQATVWMRSTWLRFVPDSLFFDRILTIYAVPGWPALAALVLALSATAALLRSSRRLLAMLTLLAFLPLMLVIICSLTLAPVFITRTMTPLSVPAILLLSIGAVCAPRPLWGWGALLVLAAAMLGADVQLRMNGPMQDWYRTADWLKDQFVRGDMVFAYPNEGKLPLAFALRDKGMPYPIRAIPSDVPALEQRHGTHPTGTRGVSSLPQTELEAIAQEPATRAVPTIWLLRLGKKTYDPGDGFLRALHRDRFIVRHWEDGPIDIVGLRKRDLAVRSAPAPARSPR